MNIAFLVWLMTFASMVAEEQVSIELERVFVVTALVESDGVATIQGIRKFAEGQGYEWENTVACWRMGDRICFMLDGKAKAGWMPVSIQFYRTLQMYSRHVESLSISELVPVHLRRVQ